MRGRDAAAHLVANGEQPPRFASLIAAARQAGDRFATDVDNR
jgi:hypothetical protein